MKAFKQRRHARPGFTLVEVTMALGIFSFGILGLLGLLPVALHTHQTSKQDTTIAQIVQRLASEVQLTDYENLDPTNTSDYRYFDQSGLEVSSGSASRIYTSQIQVLANSDLPGNGTSSCLKTVKLYVVYDPNKNGLLPSCPVASLLIGKSDPSAP